MKFEKKCYAPKCTNPPAYAVYLEDDKYGDTHFREQDITCPYLCGLHKELNETRKVDRSSYRGNQGLPTIKQIDYPFSNRHKSTGWTSYEPLGKKPRKLR